MKNPSFILLALFSLMPSILISQSGYSHRIDGENYLDAKQYDSAFQSINQSIAAYEVEGEIDSSILMNSQKALILHKKGDSNKAIELLNLILSSENEKVNKKILLALLLRKSQIYGQLFKTNDSEAALQAAYQYADTTDVSTIIDAEFLSEIAWVKMRRYKFSEALKDARKAYFGITKFYNENDKKVNGYLQLVAYLHSQLKQLDSAEVYTQKYVDNTLANYPEHDFYRGLAYNQLGTLYLEMRKFDKAIKAHKQSERIGRIQNQEGDSRLLGINCSNLSTAFSLCGESDLALDYALESLRMYLKSYGDNNIALRGPYTRISDIYQNIDEFDKAVEYAQKAYDIQIKLEPNDLVSAAYTKNFLANALAKSGNTKKAKELLFENISTFNASVGSTAYAIGTYLYLGNIYLEENNVDSALFYNKYVLKENQKTLSNFHPEIVKQYGKLAKSLTTRNPKLATAYLDTAFAYLAQMEEPMTPPSAMIEHFIPDVEGVELVLLKEEVLWAAYQSDKNEKTLHEMIDVVDAHIDHFYKYISVIRGSYSFNRILSINAEILSHAILACLEFNKQNKDKTANIIKYTALKRDVLYKLLSGHHQIEKLAEFPSELIQKNKDLKAKIQFEKEILLQHLQKDSVASIDHLSTVLEEYQQFKSEIKKSHPRFHQKLFDLNTLSLNEIQTKLPSNTTLIQYTFILDQLLILVIDQSTITTQLFPTKNLVEQIEQFSNTVQARKPVKKLGQDLYSKLIGPIAHLLANENLIIIPDGALHYLNFEILVSEENKYLIESYNIAYASSFGQYFSPLREKSKTKSKFAFAPGFSTEMKSIYKENTDSIFWDEKYLSLLQQPNTLNFTKDLEEQKFHSYIGLLANETNFKLSAPNADLLFIGTHGFLNDLNPVRSYLQFSKSLDSTDINDNQLFASEIYGIQLNTNLAFLTACKTGVGSIRKGEGMISLAHAFNSAGCSNIIHSLWSIDENSSIAIGKKFLENYSSSNDPSLALRSAKLEYLQGANTELKHPFYWGGLVLKSQMSTTSGFNNYIFMGIGVGVILLLILAQLFRTQQLKS